MLSRWTPGIVRLAWIGVGGNSRCNVRQTGSEPRLCSWGLWWRGGLRGRRSDLPRVGADWCNGELRSRDGFQEHGSKTGGTYRYSADPVSVSESASDGRAAKWA